jgi:hypothetical protein
MVAAVGGPESFSSRREEIAVKLELIVALTGSSASDYAGLRLWVFGAEVDGQWAFWRYAEGEGPGATLENITNPPAHHDGMFRQLTLPLGDLGDAVGPDWVWFFPNYLSPSFIPWFRERLGERAPAPGADLSFDRLLRSVWERRVDLDEPS